MHRSEHDWTRWSALLGLGAFLLQVTAAAQTQTPAQALLQEAHRRFDTLEYERALVELHSAQRLTPTQDEFVTIHLLKGIALAELGKKAEASDAFKDALRLQPSASLPLDVSPKISLHFEAIRAMLAAEKPQPGKQPTEPCVQAEPHVQVEPKELLLSSEQLQKASVEVHPSPPPIIYVAPEQKVEVHNQPEATQTVRAAEMHTSRALNPHILIPAGAGGVLAIAGGIFWGMARKEYSKIESDDPRLNSLSAVKGSASNGRTYQAMGFSLLGAGLAGLGVAASLYGMDRAGSSVELSVGTNGGQTVLNGRW